MVSEKKEFFQEKNRLLSYKSLFFIFLKAGMAFGGGLAILAVLERELVKNKKVVSREEFLSLYGIGKIVPAGTLTALAIAYGYKFGGIIGTVITLTALVLPAFVLTVILTIAYVYLKENPVFSFMPFSILPATIGLIFISALSLSKGSFKSFIELLFALAAFISVVIFHLNSALILIIGGVLGTLIFSRNKKEVKN